MSLSPRRNNNRWPLVVSWSCCLLVRSTFTRKKVVDTRASDGSRGPVSSSWTSLKAHQQRRGSDAAWGANSAKIRPERRATPGPQDNWRRIRPPVDRASAAAPCSTCCVAKFKLKKNKNKFEENNNFLRACSWCECVCVCVCLNANNVGSSPPWSHSFMHWFDFLVCV